MYRQFFKFSFQATDFREHALTEDWSWQCHGKPDHWGLCSLWVVSTASTGKHTASQVLQGFTQTGILILGIRKIGKFTVDLQVFGHFRFWMIFWGNKFCLVYVELSVLDPDGLFIHKNTNCIFPIYNLVHLTRL